MVKVVSTADIPRELLPEECFGWAGGLDRPEEEEETLSSLFIAPVEEASPRIVCSRGGRKLL